MPITVIQHGQRQAPGRIGLTLRDHGVKLDVRRVDQPLGGPTNNQHIPTDFDGIDGVLILGGPQNVTDSPDRFPTLHAELEFIKEAHRRAMPLVGVCLGCQLIAKALGGEVGPMAPPPTTPGCEIGMGEVTQLPIANTDTILAGIPWRQWQFQSHEQEVKQLPPGATLLQTSAACKVQSFRAGLRTYAFQYHPECDGPMILGFLQDGGEELAKVGLSFDQAVADAEQKYDSYARLSDRLCVNLASYLYSVSRKIVA